MILACSSATRREHSGKPVQRSTYRLSPLDRPRYPKVRQPRYGCIPCRCDGGSGKCKTKKRGSQSQRYNICRRRLAWHSCMARNKRTFVAHRGGQHRASLRPSEFRRCTTSNTHPRIGLTCPTTKHLPTEHARSCSTFRKRGNIGGGRSIANYQH